MRRAEGSIRKMDARRPVFDGTSGEADEGMDCILVSFFNPGA